MFRCWLAISVMAVGLPAQQLPDRQLQIREQRELEQRADEQRRQIARQQRESVEHEHAEELLAQRRNAAEAERQRLAGAVEAQATPIPEQKPIAEVLPAPSFRQPERDFSILLPARALGAGLLVGAGALVLGKLVERRLRYDT